MVATALPCGLASRPASASSAPALPAGLQDPKLREMARRVRALGTSQSPDAPLLWSATVRDAAGIPVAGASVVAYVIAPASSADNADPGLVPVASAWSASDGTVAIHADPELVRPYLKDGYVNIWYAFSAGADFTLAADTVSLSDDPQHPWRTSTIEEAIARGQVDPTSSPDGFASTIRAEIAHDQPASVTIARPADGTTPSAYRRGPDIPTLCSVSRSFANSVGRVTVGTIYLDESWTSTFSYVNQTIHQTQWNASVSVNAPLNNVSVGMGVGGTLTVTQQVSGGNINVSGTTLAGEKLSKKIQPVFEFQNQEWQCISTIPNVKPTYKLVDWPWRVRFDLGVSYPQSNTVPACNANTKKVLARKDFNRSTGTSTTDYGAEYSFNLGIPGIGASVTAQSSTTYVQSATQFWVNNSNSDRWLCAANGDLAGTATVVATSRK